MRASVPLVLFAVFFLLLPATKASGYELKTRYTIIVYETEELLRRFNREVSMGSLSYLVRNRNNVTIADETVNKVDAIFERVEALLDMFPRGVQFKIVLLPSDRDVQRTYKGKYGADVDYISYYSPRDKTVFISVDDVRIGVLAHELAHVVVDLYFGVPPPQKIHELLAQFVETHLKD